MAQLWITPTSSSHAGMTSSSPTMFLPLNIQMTSSTPFNFSPGVDLLSMPLSAATTRESLDLFHKNASRYVMEQPPRRLSITTDFALSALKNSFSMSSLSQQCHSGLPADAASFVKMQTPEVRLKYERPFNSLTRLQERDVARRQWRRSLGSSPLKASDDASLLDSGGPQSATSSTTNANWPALQADYTYLMSCDLIESCRSPNLSLGSCHRENLNTTRSVCFGAPDNNKSVILDVRKDAKILSTPDLKLQLRLLRGWLKRMENRVPKLMLRPKWTRETIDRRIVDYKALQRKIQGYSAQFGEACQRCSSWNPRLGRWLENRYHRLLLRILEWIYHLENLTKTSLELEENEAKEAQALNVRKRLSFESEEEDISSSESLMYQYSSSDQDWLQNSSLALDDIDLKENPVPTSFISTISEAIGNLQIRGGSKSDSLNRTFLMVPGASPTTAESTSPVVLNTSERIETRRPSSMPEFRRRLPWGHLRYSKSAQSRRRKAIENQRFHETTNSNNCTNVTQQSPDYLACSSTESSSSRGTYSPSSLSEKSCNNYLEPCGSEDLPETESALALIESHENYGQDIESLSNCSSGCHYYSPKRLTPHKQLEEFVVTEDSLAELHLLHADPDEEYLIQIIEKSVSQFNVAVSTFNEVSSSSRLERLTCAGLLETCNTNIECLQSALNCIKMSGDNFMQNRESWHSKLKPFEDLIKKWVQMDEKLIEFKKIDDAKTQFDAEKQESLLGWNTEMHSYKVQQPKACLKDDSMQLACQTQAAPSASASDAKQMSASEFTVNTEKEAAPNEAPVLYPSSNWSDTQQCQQRDSGISSGSDVEVTSLRTEREKRLCALRQLAHDLETTLAPGKEALMRINRTLDETQPEVLLLHNRLSLLPTIPVTISAAATPSSPPFKEIAVQTEPQLNTRRKYRRLDTAFLSTAPTTSRPSFSYWWRIVKVLRPFVLAVLVLLLTTCLIEPFCCDYLNNFGSSFVPKLSYMDGPPPV